MIYGLFDVENTPYFVLIFGIILIMLAGFLIYKLIRFEKNFVSNKIQIISRIEIDSETNEESIKLSLVNRGFNSVDVRGFGFKHYNHDYDFMKQYKESHDMKLTDKLVIGARETLEATIDIDNLKVKLNSTNIKKFKAYAIDSYGNYVLKNAKYVERYIELFFKKVEFVKKVEAMTPEKQAKYKAKEEKLDSRAKGVISKSLKTKLNNDELNYIVPSEPIENNVDEIIPKEESVQEEVTSTYEETNKKIESVIANEEIDNSVETNETIEEEKNIEQNEDLQDDSNFIYSNAEVEVISNPLDFIQDDDDKNDE